jgi:hypothetical protein
MPANMHDLWLDYVRRIELLSAQKLDDGFRGLTDPNIIPNKQLECFGTGSPDAEYRKIDNSNQKNEECAQAELIFTPWVHLSEESQAAITSSFMIGE